MFLIRDKKVELRWPDNGVGIDMGIDSPVDGQGKRIDGVLFVADDGKAYICHDEVKYDRGPASPNLMGKQYSYMFFSGVKDGCSYRHERDFLRAMFDEFIVNSCYDAYFHIGDDDCVVVEEYLSETLKEV